LNDFFLNLRYNKQSLRNSYVKDLIIICFFLFQSLKSPAVSFITY